MIFIKIVRRKSLRMEFKTDNNNNNNNNNNNENDKIIKKIKCYKQKDNEMEDKNISEIENEIEIKRGLDDNLKSPFFKEDGNEVEYISETESETESEIEDDYMDIDIDIDIDIDADMRSVDENDYGYYDYDYGLGYEDECYECLDI